MAYSRAQLKEDQRRGLWMAIVLTMVAALPLGFAGVANLVREVSNRPLEMSWSTYGAIWIAVPGSYVVASQIGAVAFFLLRPLRRWLIGWMLTGFTLAIIVYDTIGVIAAIFYDPVGKTLLEYSSPEEAWRFARLLTPVFGIIGLIAGAWQWWKVRAEGGTKTNAF